MAERWGKSSANWNHASGVASTSRRGANTFMRDVVRPKALGWDFMPRGTSSLETGIVWRASSPADGDTGTTRTYRTGSGFFLRAEGTSCHILNVLNSTEGN